MSTFINMQRYVAHLQLNRIPIYLGCGFCCSGLIFTLALVFIRSAESQRLQAVEE